MKIKNFISVVFLLIMASVLLLSFNYRKTSNSNNLNAEQRMKNGRKIVLGLCAGCHGSEDGKLAGKHMKEMPGMVGKIIAPNITNSVENGIGKYTREQLRILLRTGIKSDGKRSFPLMPYFPLMSDDDVEGIIDFLQSADYAVQASEQNLGKLKLKFVGRMWAKSVKAGKIPQSRIENPDTNNTMEYGKYLTDAVYRCFECHSGTMKVNFENPRKTKKYNAGGAKMADMDKKKVYSRNITPHKETGIGNWTLEDFTKMMRNGVRKNGRNSRFPMLAFPLMSDNDIKSIYTYLMSVPPIKHKVKEYVPK
ncbi:MAG: cytochrome c [Bacteroidetes bacterium]|nr:cytochrome c [Bacteroidota bacterium]